MDWDLAFIAAAIIAFAIVMYVLMDGFDLGIGILYPALPDDAARDQAMNAVAPVWDGNETWLVLGGTLLFAAFPIAYATVASALYLPLIVMLIGLIFRGVAFEFRFKSGAHKPLWDWSFALGSLVATLAQGLVLGAFVEGRAGEQPLTTFAFLSPFSVMTAVAIVAGYALLGAAWLVMKTTGAVAAWSRRAAPWLLLAVLVFMGAVSLWMPLAYDRIADRWFGWPNLLILAPVPILVLVAAGVLARSLLAGHERTPFLMTLALFLLAYLGLGISLWPYIVPFRLTLWQAAAPEASQTFLLAGVIPLVIVVLIYTAYSYWVFRGKVQGEGYH